MIAAWIQSFLEMLAESHENTVQTQEAYFSW